MTIRSRISEGLAVGVVFAVAACQGSFSLNSKLGGKTTPSDQEASGRAPQAQAEQGSSESSGSSNPQQPVATAETGTATGGGGGGGSGVGTVIATGNTPEEKKGDASDYLKQGLKEANERCKSRVNVQMDWPSFGPGYKWIDYDSDEPGFNERVTATRCGKVLEHLGQICDMDKAGAAVAALKVVKCSYEPNRRQSVVTGDMSNGVLTVKFNYGMDSDMSTVGMRTFLLMPNGVPVAENTEVPKVEKQLSRDTESLAQLCGIPDLSIKVDWASFRGHYGRGPAEVLSYWEGMRGGLSYACREHKSFFAGVKTFEIKFDGSIERGNAVQGGAHKYEKTNGVFRLRLNWNHTIANMEETLIKYVKSH